MAGTRFHADLQKTQGLRRVASARLHADLQKMQGLRRVAWFRAQVFREPFATSLPADKKVLLPFQTLHLAAYSQFHNCKHHLLLSLLVVVGNNIGRI